MLFSFRNNCSNPVDIYSENTEQFIVYINFITTTDNVTMMMMVNNQTQKINRDYLEMWIEHFCTVEHYCLPRYRIYCDEKWQSTILDTG